MSLPAPNHTQTPNAFFDDILPQITSLAELKVTMAIIRQTFGWHKAEDKISLSQLEKLTGLSRESVIEGIKLSMKRGTVGRRKVGQGYIYGLRVESTSQESRLPLVKNSDQQLVKNSDPQKKEKESPTNVGTDKSADERMPIEKNPVGYLVDLLNENKKRGLHPPPLTPKQRSEYGQFVKQALLDGEPPERCEVTLHWLVAKASGEINDQKKAWAYFGTGLDAARDGWRPKARLKLVTEEHKQKVAENEALLADILAGGS